VGNSRYSDVVTVIGGGLAGAEAAWQIARRGVRVRLYEMRPLLMTPAHRTGLLAELVCSNSLGSVLPDRPAGMLLEELALLRSLLREAAQRHRVPAGHALAVDRRAFATEVTRRLALHPLIRIVREEVCEIPAGVVVVAAGPLVSPALSRRIAEWAGGDHLYFFDAVAPMVTAESVDLSQAFYASRYGRGGELDYLNCPLTEDEYRRFVAALREADRVRLRNFEAEIEQGVKAGRGRYFERCLPIEVMARRGWLTLAHGPMRPTGLVDPRTGRRPFAVLQLRRDDAAGRLYHLVGMQTNLRYAEQERVFRLIPALRNAEFVRYGQMHRNTFVCAPRLIHPTMQCRRAPEILFAGQITGVEGYAGNIASGLVAGINAARIVHGERPVEFPPETMTGALCRYVASADPDSFQPMKANFGLLPEPGGVPGRARERHRRLAERGLARLQEFLGEIGLSEGAGVSAARCD